MRIIYVIGTVHTGESDILAELEKLDPDQVLIEIAQEDIETGKLGAYPPEMTAVLEWARAHDKSFAGIDVYVEQEEPSPQELERIEQVNNYIKSKDWKELNKKKHWNKMRELYGKDLITPGDRARQELMLANVKKMMLPEGKVVIITGIGHLTFFEAQLKDAIFPFR